MGAGKKAVRYAGFLIRKREYANGTKAWQLDLGWKHGRKRYTFDTLEAAKVEADAKANELLNRGNATFAMTDRQRLDAVEAAGLLKGAVTLTDAARCWLRYNRQVDTGQTFAALAEGYLADMKARELTKLSIDGTRRRLARMTRDMGKLPAVRIAPADITNWLDAQEAKKENRRNYISAVRGMFNWAIEEKVIALEANPAASKSKRRGRRKQGQETKDLPAILPLATVQKIMRVAENTAPDCAAFLALCFFGGLRPMNEAGRATWDAIDFDNDTIRVCPEHAKTRRARLVTIAPNLREWLLRYRLANKGEQVAPPYGTLVKRLRKIKAAARVATWPKDVARHCFASAHLALNSDIQKTCLELGHKSPEMLFTHYRNLMSAKQAADYFAIKPGDAAAAADAGKAATA